MAAARKDALLDVKRQIRNLTIVSALLAIALAAVVVYLVYPSVKLAVAGAPFGQTLAGINNPLTAAQLGVINNAPNSYFEIAGQKLLNGTLTDSVGAGVSNTPKLGPAVVNGKPSVIYIGAISCIFCGENRWAMALALSRFGNFSSLYYGYSSFGDADVPTLYWKPNNYTAPSGATFGNYYKSNLINFYSIEYDSPIVQGFQMQPLSYFVGRAPNATYAAAVQFMNATGKYQGTPFTFWGTYIVAGADGEVFGNTTPTSAGALPLTNMTHQDVLNQLQNFNDQFSWGEYAAADIYIAELCPSINNSAPVCSLPAIKQIQQVYGF
jgi:hypothetical protein